MRACVRANESKSVRMLTFLSLHATGWVRQLCGADVGARVTSRRMMAMHTYACMNVPALARLAM